MVDVIEFTSRRDCNFLCSPGSSPDDVFGHVMDSGKEPSLGKMIVCRHFAFKDRNEVVKGQVRI